MDHNHKDELDYWSHLGKKRINSLKVSFEITDRELGIILKLHAKSNKKEEIYLTPLLKKK